MRKSRVIAVSGALILGAVLATALINTGKRPTDEHLIQNFHKNYHSYERLRDMLTEDKTLLRVANWGVDTESLGPHSVKVDGDFPLSRYHEYLALLNQAGGRWAFRSRGDHPDSVGVGMWASGFGADTSHVEICWKETPPTNLVSNLDGFYKNPRPRRPAFRQIEGNWYLAAD